MVMNGTTIVPLLFTSITSDSHQVPGERPPYAFLYNETVLLIITGANIDQIVMRPIRILSESLAQEARSICNIDLQKDAARQVQLKQDHF